MRCSQLDVLARAASGCRRRDAEGLIFYRCRLFFLLLLSFFRRLISEVTERISTELRHIFTYGCYLKNLTRTNPGIYPQWTGGKKPVFWDRL